MDQYEGNDGDDADAAEEEAASQADDGLMQTLEDGGYSTGECEDWTVYIRPVKYNNDKTNVTTTDQCKAMTVL